MKKGLFILTLLTFTLVLASCSNSSMKEEKIMNDSTMMDDNSMNKNDMMTDDKMMEDSAMMDDKTMEDMSMEKNDMMTDDKMMEKKWVYTSYDSSKLSDSKSNILFFAASWCPSCVSADKNFSSEEIPQNLNILKVDYDNSSDLKKKYWVTMQHTFVLVDKDLEMIKKWSWSNESKDILSQIN